LIENFFVKIKQFHAIATRYEKTARNFLTAVQLSPASWAQLMTGPNAIADRDAPSAQLLAVSQLDGVLIVMIFVVADNQCAACAVMISPISLG
jgi:hypothetical protein